jgi:bifunctional non-homologous end joining protein LigD
MQTPSAVKSASLYFCEGSSDKVYHASVERSGSGFLVNFAYGRRGSTLQTGTKTSSPLDLDKATKIFDRLVAEKKAKGYTEQEGGVAFAGTENAGRVSGLVPQLLNAIDRAQAERLIDDPAYCAQEKFNGERRMTRGMQGSNRKGLFVPLPTSLADDLRGGCVRECELDGEQVGDEFHVFDILGIDGTDARDQPYMERLQTLADAVGNCGSLHRVATAYTTAEKRALFDRVQAAGGEGIVFKRLDAPYTPGKPASGGSQFKFKFIESASVVVAAQNAQRSVRMAVIEGGRPVEVGNVTIPPSKVIPAVGTVIEVSYLYAHRGGALYQPVYLGVRGDLDPTDCTIEQLKFKPVA